ncbi:MAG: HD-GYP domain-containing protein, partial [Candidatus Latescibacteria bacterium]|nr:HD-GYP domain-containing protein [Candidatus Latescibacterota bacterium]
MRLINIDSLRDGMQAGQDLYDEHSRLMLGRGAIIKGHYVARLKTMGVPALYVQDADTSDIAAPETIPPAARAKAVQNLTNTFSAVTKSLEGLRQLSLEEAHQHVRSKRFIDTFKSTTGDQGIDQIVGDVDTLVNQIMNKEVVVGLNSIKTHDNYTFQHSIDVTIMGLLLARKIGWKKEQLMIFGIGCLLHDVGKIFIESEILNKPGRLSDTEFESMKSHPSLGYELVRTIAPNINTLVSHVAYQHHERQDGSGYPRGIVGNEELGKNESGTIHDFGAVAAVADIFDAMASDRPYRQGWPTDRVIGLIRDLSGSHLNPKIVDIFERTVAP